MAENYNIPFNAPIITAIAPMNAALAILWLGITQVCFEYTAEPAHADWVHSFAIGLVPRADLYEGAERVGRNHLEICRSGSAANYGVRDWSDQALEGLVRAWARFTKAGWPRQAEEVERKGELVFGHENWSAKAAAMITSSEMEEYCGE
ncbi:hypothetical protein K432DRAFT_404329 [Lepidopterella palustris CBS 459.81]|uniref:Uncharacterized protein n=1 Tax=Lepidopterella palustris CBS 459.81 TaxID=1314670 RepID=A0A8E2EBP6_9PEZI|nr:hypothetical protein K432DRAFT_404329 [Lepidopterella palustris CBS 459.81]